MMKKIFLLLCVCLPMVTFGADFDDDENRPSVEELESRLEKMIIKRAKLSEKEATSFLTLYREFQKKQRELGKEIFELKDDTYDSPKAYAEAITKIRSLEVQLASNAQSYTLRLLKVLPAKKVFRIMKVEDDFRRNLVKGERGKGNMQPDNMKGSAVRDDNFEEPRL